MDISRGKVDHAKKTVVYGPEGIGKSTFASKFPEAVFIDTEGSTNDMDVARLPRPTSWTMLLEEVEYIRKNPTVCKTLVIDTIDWAEQMCMEYICSTHHKTGIEDFGYGNGYVYTREEFGRFLNCLTDLIEIGINVVLTAHAQLRKFEQPDELGAYDRWELKLGKKTSSQTSPLVKEWADMLLFCNYKTYAIAVDDKGKKHKAQGGKRVMYTAHHPCWDAKNRYGLPEECDFDYSVIAKIIESGGTKRTVPASAQIPSVSKQASDTPKAPQAEPKQQEMDFMNIPKDADEEVPFDKPEEAARSEPIPEGSIFKVSEAVPKALRDLMEQNLVSEEEIQKVVADKGYYPLATPITNYDPQFVNGVLVGAWKQVFETIKKLRDSYEIPFDEK